MFGFRQKPSLDRSVSDAIAAACGLADNMIGLIGDRLSSAALDTAYKCALKATADQARKTVLARGDSAESAELVVGMLMPKVSAGLRTHLAGRIPLARCEVSGSA